MQTVIIWVKLVLFFGVTFPLSLIGGVGAKPSFPLSSEVAAGLFCCAWALPFLRSLVLPSLKGERFTWERLVSFSFPLEIQAGKQDVGLRIFFL